MPRAVRRPARARQTVAAGLLALAVSGCSGLGQPAPYDSQGIDGLVIPTPTADPDDFVAGIDNPWLPLTPGSTWSYDVSKDGATTGTIASEVLAQTSAVAGLDATGVRTTQRIEGVETTSTRYYAQDDAGNVWWVGEDSEGLAWRAGEDGALAGLAMPASPRLGDGWEPYVVPGRDGASVRVDEQGRDMVQTRDKADTTTLSSYTSGVGLVGVEDLDRGWVAVLIEHRPG